MPRLTPVRRINLMKKFDEGNRVVIAAHREMAFVFRDGVHIHETNNNKAQGAGYSPIRIFFDNPSYDALEALSVQNHHWTFRAESPGIIAGGERRCFFPALYRHYVMVIFILQRRTAERAFLFIHQLIRPEHSSRDGCVKLFHVLSKTSFTLNFTILWIKS
jgi:hypothetical protein